MSWGLVELPPRHWTPHPTGESGEQDAHLDWDVELANLHWWLLFQLPAVHFAV